MTVRFPRLQGRDLTGRRRWLPDAFTDGLNLVFVAFRRDQQTVIDSWAPWLSGPQVTNRLAFWEVPTLGRRMRAAAP